MSCVESISLEASFRREESQDEVEFFYKITVRNCSSITLHDVLLKFTLSSPAYNVTVESCGVKVCGEWNGVTKKYIFRKFTLVPGIFEFWIRFRRELGAENFFPSVLHLTGHPEGFVHKCEYSCGIQKCCVVDDAFCIL